MSTQQMAERLIKFYINEQGFVASVKEGKEIGDEYVVPTMILRGVLEGNWDWYYNWYWYGINGVEGNRFYLWESGHLKEVIVKS